jgi:AraC-like DNA-binding protein
LISNEMRSTLIKPASPAELSWLSEVSESRQSLNELSPIYVRSGIVASGPPVPYPEFHHYCEIGTCLEGKATSFVEQERAEREPGDLLLLGPGVPHWATVTEYPLKFITVYFLPSAIIDLGPDSDGPRILGRFTQPQSLAERLVQFPPGIRRRFSERFQDMAKEFERKDFGRELRLRILLMQHLLELFQWEQKTGRVLLGTGMEFDWKPINKALRFLREHFNEPVYSRDVARAAGVSQSRLRVLFQAAIGMPWVNYLRGLRVHRAAAYLCEGKLSITEVALAAGFESQSHFNVTFRSLMHVSPTAYQQIHSRGRRRNETSQKSPA